MRLLHKGSENWLIAQKIIKILHFSCTDLKIYIIFADRLLFVKEIYNHENKYTPHTALGTLPTASYCPRQAFRRQDTVYQRLQHRFKIYQRCGGVFCGHLLAAPRPLHAGGGGPQLPHHQPDA
jgi:hypothetical protein